MNKGQSILVVDSEKNVRMSMVRALESGGFHVESAMTGEEALLMLEASAFHAVFLDLKLPGVAGIEVLRKVKRRWPSTRVVVVTAHGTVDNAVEAMRLGASDFIPMPFTPEELRGIAKAIPASAPEENRNERYAGCVTEARRSIVHNQIAAALASARTAAGIDPARPEAFNLLGAATHLSGDRYRAQSYFRAAIALDPTYGPAFENLDRSTAGGVHGLYMELSLGRAEGDE
jgi:DNA-binding NtrC family response regulator